MGTDMPWSDSGNFRGDERWLRWLTADSGSASMRYDPRTWGFRQARPTQPGVYFIVADRRHECMRPPNRIREGWEVAHVFWENDGYGLHEPTESGIWRIKTLGGIEYTWVKGTWLKGPIDPTVILNRPAPQHGGEL